MGILGTRPSTCNPRPISNQQAPGCDEPISPAWPDSPKSTRIGYVDRVVRLPHGRFAVFISIGRASLLVNVSAKNLLVFRRFQIAALAELGIVVRNPQFTARDTGQAEWEEMLVRHLHCWEAAP